MNFPLELSFKIMALSPQVSVTDAAGNLVFYVKQKAFKLKEAVTVFADREQTRPLYHINADRVLDISAQYHFQTPAGVALGSVRRQGMRSFWRAHYEVLAPNGAILFHIREENPWSKVADGFLGELPVLGLFAGYLFHPRYRVSRTNETDVLRLEKQPAFLESKYTITQLAELSTAEQGAAVLSLLMMVLLERRRG